MTGLRASRDAGSTQTASGRLRIQARVDDQARYRFINNLILSQLVIFKNITQEIVSKYRNFYSR